MRLLRSTARSERRRSPRRLLALGCSVVVVLALVVALGYAAYRWLTWPDVAALRTDNPTMTAFIGRYESRTGKKVTLRWTPWDRIDTDLGYAVVVAEDSEFLDHDGFSHHEIGVALKEAMSELRAPRGASTITQQLAKNLWLSPSRNPLRKVEEAILTRQLEHALSKRRILELYLNVVEFGPGVYGAGEATRYYFGRRPRRLSPRRCAMLAASLPRPSVWHPGVDRPGYERYVETILGRMHRFEGLRDRLEEL
jgi:monofunctional biosynthetic peptidoglycan transglycosylase